MSMAFDALMTALAGLYAGEGRAGGDAAAAALLAARGHDLPAPQPVPNPGALKLALDQSGHPLAALMRDAAPLLCWVPSELDGRIRAEIASRVMQCELVGPDGMVFDERVRVGLWVMEPNLTYPERAHAAEETFHILSGHALWSADESAFARRGEGATIHHPSMVPHANSTRDLPMMAAWRWSGDIGFADYRLKG